MLSNSGGSKQFQGIMIKKKHDEKKETVRAKSDRYKNWRKKNLWSFERTYGAACHLNQKNTMKNEPHVCSLCSSSFCFLLCLSSPFGSVPTEASKIYKWNKKKKQKKKINTNRLVHKSIVTLSAVKHPANGHTPDVRACNRS